MNLGFLTLGLAFLFNPNVNIIDVFPDFIGYILIYHALEKSSDIVERLADARKLFWKLFLITLVKTACIIPMFASRDDITLLLTFISAVLELIYLIPAIIALFEGLVYSGSRFDGTAVFKKADSLKHFTVMFVILKAVCSVLPEFTSLSMFDELGTVTAASIDIRKYKPYFIEICAAVTLIFGIIWIIRMVRYTRGISKDNVFIGNIDRKYRDEILPKKEMFISRNMKTVSTFIILGVIGSITFFLDGVNIVPNILGAAFFIFAFIYLIKYEKRKSLFGIIFTSLYGIISVGNTVLQSRFSTEYNAEALKWVAEAESLYNMIKAGMIIQQVLFIVMIMILTSMYLGFVKSHTYLLYPTDETEHKKSMNDSLIKELNSRLNIFGTAAIAFGAVTALQPAVTFNFAQIWMISAVISVIFVIATFWVMNEINENLYNKYLYYN